MTKEEAKKFGLQLLHGIMERNGSYPVYANNVKQAIEALSEPDGSSEIPNDLEEAAKSHRSTANYGGDINLAMEDSYKKGAKWQKGQDEKELSEKIAAAYQLGLADKEKQMMDEWLKDRDGCFWDGVEEGKKAMREQMMKEAVDAEVWNYASNEDLRAIPIWGINKFRHLKDGDKVRIIIVKED